MKGVIQHIVTKESIQEVSVLRDLLVNACSESYIRSDSMCTCLSGTSSNPI